MTGEGCTGDFSGTRNVGVFTLCIFRLYMCLTHCSKF